MFCLYTTKRVFCYPIIELSLQIMFLFLPLNCRRKSTVKLCQTSVWHNKGASSILTCLVHFGLFPSGVTVSIVHLLHPLAPTNVMSTFVTSTHLGFPVILQRGTSHRGLLLIYRIFTIPLPQTSKPFWLLWLNLNSFIFVASSFAFVTFVHCLCH